MMYVVVNDKGVVLSAPMSYEEADATAIELSIIYKGLHLVPTEQKPHDVGYVATGEAEVVEDVGCAGGACTL